MGTILIVDDTPFWRDITADLLRMKGYTAITAADGTLAMVALSRQPVDMIILDIEMPLLQGLTFLEKIRREEIWKNLPVVMLTGDMQKEHIILAKKLGVVDYMLKARFSPQELMARVEKCLDRPKMRATVPAAAPAPAPTAPAIHTGAAIPRLMDREHAMARADKALAGRTMSGIVSQVISAANSPRTDLADLGNLIGRDSVLTARVLKAANTNTNATSRGTINTLTDAVRILGSENVRNIAASVGVFDAMPAAEKDGFHPIRAWQHSIATAMLCAKLAPRADSTTAYLVGLCHDLGEILFRSHFGSEYKQVMEVQKASGKPLLDVQRQMLGMTHGELAERILLHLGLPPAICTPITLFHDAVRTHASLTDPIARVLQMAEDYAIGMQLSASEQDLIRPFAKVDCRTTTGVMDPPRPDDAQLRGDIFSMTAVYAQLSFKQMQKLVEPVYPRSTSRVFVAREGSISSFDPITAALESLAETVVGAHIPPAEDLAKFNGLVVLTRTSAVAGFTAFDIKEAAGDRIPVLWLAGVLDKAASTAGDTHSALLWPIALCDLASFVRGLPAAKPADATPTLAA
jgi:HD-like signal output (HDOD) protein/CheY-like chemotaxis protein